MKKFTTLLILATTFPQLHASDWQITAGISYADISGKNVYAAGRDSNTNTQRTDSLSVPFLKISKSFSEKFNLSYTYSYYDELINNGFSPEGQIFNSEGGITQALVDYRYFEKIQEHTLGISYSLYDNKTWNVRIGPSISIAQSKAEFFEVQQVGTLGSTVFMESLSPLRNFNETDYSIGAELTTQYKLTNKTRLNFNYRYSSLGDKDINLFGIGLTIDL